MIGFAIGLLVGVFGIFIALYLIDSSLKKTQQDLKRLDGEISKKLAELSQHSNELRKMGEIFEKLKQKQHQHKSHPTTRDQIDEERATPELAEKLSQLHEIGLRMMELEVGIKQPNKNQLHALYKNALITEIKELAKERDNIIKELWDSEWNPMINVLEPDGSHSKRYLRDVLAESLSNNEIQVENKKPNLRLVEDTDE